MTHIKPKFIWAKLPKKMLKPYQLTIFTRKFSGNKLVNAIVKQLQCVLMIEKIFLTPMCTEIKSTVWLQLLIWVQNGFVMLWFSSSFYSLNEHVSQKILFTSFTLLIPSYFYGAKHSTFKRFIGHTFAWCDIKTIK